MEIVEYRDVAGYPGYRVGSDGSVWSQHRVGGPPLYDDWVLKSQRRHRKSGYFYVGLYRDGKTRSIAVHRLVLQAFVGLRPAGKQCRHRDGDQANNRSLNLCWGTPLENSDDKTFHGTKPVGAGVPSSKLTDRQIIEIRARRRRGEKLRTIAAAFGVHNATISRICTGRQWVHV